MKNRGTRSTRSVKEMYGNKQTKKNILGDERVGVRLSYHNWKLAACVESLKSIPIETVTEASGSSRSVEAGGRRRGEREE